MLRYTYTCETCHTTALKDAPIADRHTHAPA